MSGDLDVSRETWERLEVYANLLKKWNKRINLVSKSSIEHLWSRHIQDSLQLYDQVSHPVDHWVDLGSGGGFPGIPIAVCAAEKKSPLRVTLVESDTRKCAFLRSVLRETGVNATIENIRIEDLASLNADIVSARALAELETLLGFAHRHVAETGRALFLKGRTWQREVERAQRSWQFTYQVAKSTVDADAVVLSISGDLSDRSKTP